MIVAFGPHGNLLTGLVERGHSVTPRGSVVHGGEPPDVTIPIPRTGKLHGLGLGVEEVELAAPGRPCGECGAGTGITWAPGGEVPKGVVIPPAGAACAAIVVPVEANDSATPVGQ